MTSPLLMRQHCYIFHSEVAYSSHSRRALGLDSAFLYFPPMKLFSWAFALCLCVKFYAFGILRYYSAPQQKENFSIALHKILNIHKNGTFLVFNYNLFNHETAAKLYTEKCWIFMARVRTCLKIKDEQKLSLFRSGRAHRAKCECRETRK